MTSSVSTRTRKTFILFYITIPILISTISAISMHFGFLAVYSNTFESIVRSQQMSINFQEWRSVTQGIRTGWGNEPAIIDICVSDGDTDLYSEKLPCLNTVILILDLLSG